MGGCSDAADSLPTVTLAAPTTATSTTKPVSVETTVPVIDGMVITPQDDLAAIVAAADEGSAFLLASGTHRSQVVVPKDGMTFVGLSGAVLSGAVVLDEFQADGANWRLDGIEMTGRWSGECVPEYEACAYSQDLFMDDVMLWQVDALEQLGEGRWFWDGESIYVANDPETRRVELSVTEHAFLGSASDVTISSLEIVKYATPAQLGTIQAEELDDAGRSQGWLITDVEVSGSHGAAIRTGDNTTVRGAYVHHNGQMGITVSSGSGVVLEDNEIAFNNTAGFDWGWEAGGLKATETVDLVVRNNYSHDNDGPGLWTDIDTIDTLYEGNRVVDNTAAGIFHEISDAAIIRNNTVTGNGFGKPEWLWGAGILISSSSNVEIYGNTVTNNADGIGLLQQDRGSGPLGPRLLANVSVYDNTIRMETGQTGVVEDTGNDAVFTERNLVFTANTYVDISGRRFAWNHRDLNQAAWLETGQDDGAVWE